MRAGLHCRIRVSHGSQRGAGAAPLPAVHHAIFNYPPLGDTWYNSLQSKATKRFSHGLDFIGTFTWSKQEYIGSEQDFVPGFVNPAQNDVKNRRQNKYLSGFDQPFLFTFAANYTTPNLKGGGFIGRNKVLSWIARDWTVGAVLRYGSGLPIMVPLANNALATYLFTGGYAASPSNGTFVDPGTRSAALYSESQLPLLQSEPDFRPESEGLGGPAPGAIRHCGRILQRLPATTPAG